MWSKWEDLCHEFIKSSILLSDGALKELLACHIQNPVNLSGMVTLGIIRFLVELVA